MFDKFRLEYRLKCTLLKYNEFKLKYLYITRVGCAQDMFRRSIYILQPTTRSSDPCPTFCACVCVKYRVSIAVGCL